MERHIEIFLKRLSYVAILIGTVTFVFLLLKIPDTCVAPGSPPKPHLRFPKSSCDASPRLILPLHKKNKRLWSTKTWQNKVHSFSNFFRAFYQMGLLHNESKVLCASAGAGHEVMALTQLGVADVTGIELLESPPLVSRADPHNLPYFDNVFDLGFSAHFAEALFPNRFAAEMERTVKAGGVCVVVVDECGDEEIREIVDLFRNSRFLGALNVTLTGLRMTRIIMKVKRLP
ncbi:hypothetical protein D8674_035754 [Pyrus ussuriensis x Pyrus communis]|uniref:Methyltransferase type 11 domain-containing protein n=1 Tax=Pyrus ussuriensis x Pyrus communis TaxID=2448454 RepID=A0A5N5GDT1_9ROSA|nr:hypothetical protein D8674_035754 [Pyrus ussuriensis x Pyrus communis]